MHRPNPFIFCLALLCLAQLAQAQCPTSGNVVVTSNANAGTNTLRWAIDCINTVTPLTTIIFNIPAAGIQTINLNSSLPAVTKANALIDGNANETAVIDGSIISALSDGIVISAANVTVRGLRITNFNSTAPGGAAIRISGDNATVSDNYLYNNRIGIIVRDISPTGMVDPAVAPLITGNTIGENATGAASGNSGQGILFENTPNSAIVRDNNIAHNGSNGVRANTTGGTLLISENSMFCNASAGIFRLSSPAAPTITQANTQRIRGTASGGNLVEIFEYHDTGCAATDPCQGRTLLGTTTANALGFWTFTLAAGAVTPGNQVTATRTAGGNNTFPFAPCEIIADCSGFSVSITPTAITCNGENNGQLTASAPGGSSTSYVWSNGATSPLITGLGPGTYSVTATDAAGCTATATHTLSNPPLLTVGMSGTNITCFGAANGTATSTPAGGTPNYQYSWSNSGNTPTLSNLGPGTYFVTVADANLCRTIGNVTITQPAALNISCAEQNPTSTVGGSDGSATVQIAGGTAGYAIAWSGAASGSQNQAMAGTAVVTGLRSGNYFLTVTDSNGCQQTCNFSIGSPNCNITLQISGTNPTCNGAANGSINLTVNGATGNLNFDWNVNAIDGLQNPTGLSAGTYSVTVTDAANCTASTSITLTQPAALAIVCGQQNPVSVIGGSDGSATVQIAGGTAGYAIAWSGAASGSQNQAMAGTAVITGLRSGNYSLTVTDANGCQQTCNFSIGSPNCNITLQISGTNPTCNGAANGSISLTVNGATGNLNFDWNVNAIDGLQNPTGLSAGTYSVTVTDAANCTASTSITLTQPAALAIVCGQQNPVSVIGGSDGSATVQIAGGTAGYAIAWSGAASGSQNQAMAGTAVITGLRSGNYFLTVTDANGCQQTCNFSIGSPNCNITLQIAGNNPTCNGAANGSINLTVNGATGSLNFDWNVNAIDGLQNPTGLSAGTYSVTVTDAANCTASSSITLTQPAALAIVCGQQNPVSVIGGSDGSATVQIAGGTAAYSLAWNGAASGSQNQAAAGTATITGLVSGNYSLTVTDANGCRQICNFSIGSPNCNITLQISGTNPTCNGAANGSINLTVNGATGNLNFDWNVNALDGQQNPTALSAGTYSVTVTDAGGCTASRSIVLTDPPALQLNVSATPETIAGANNGTATAAATGGSGSYTFAWNNGANTSTITGLSPGNYSATVTDGNLCTANGTVNVAAGPGGGGSCVAQPVYAVAVPARVCQGDTIRLEADDLYSSPNVRYVWFVPNGDSVTTVQPRVGILAASGAYSGQYFALRDSLGCRSIRVGGAPVQVQSLPDDAATVAMMDTVLCAPGVVTLRALPALGGTGMWQSLNAATVDNPANEQTTARNLQRGPNRFVWQVRLDGCTFSASDTVTVTVEAPPVLLDDRYTLQRVQDVLVMEVLLNDNLSGLPDTVLSLIGSGPAVGQLELLDGRRFRYTVTEDFRGKVSFQYVVCNPGAQCGTACDTATVTIEVLNMPVVPGGLIVDDPGPNGQLTIRGLNGFSRVEMQIFSRWGDLVFEEKQYDNGSPWQGHAHRSGNALPEGAYYYVLRAFDGNVQVGEAQRGVVHLFR